MYDRQGDLRLLGLSVAGDCRANSLRRICREVSMLASGEISRGSRQSVQLVEPGHWMAIRFLHDHSTRLVRPKPGAHVPTRRVEARCSGHSTQPEHAACDKSLPADDGESEIPESGINGEDGFRFVVHGCGV